MPVRPGTYPTVAQAAEILGVSKATLLRRIRAGTVRATRAGGHDTAPWVIDGEDWFRLLEHAQAEAGARAERIRRETGDH